MPISWYPGHMHKARRELGSLLRGARLVIEVLDARIPAASSNPLLASMRGNLPLIRVLNKCDLADDDLTAAWQTHFAGLQDSACLANGRNSPLDRNRLLEQIRHLAGAAPGGKTAKPGRIAIVGIPNVGKSSLMNLCIGRKLARTGNTPSVTREQQFTRFAGDWTMVDTPGMLRPKLEDQHAALLMASIGSIGAAAADTMEVAGFLANLLLDRHRERLGERYGVEKSDATPELFDRIAVSCGALKKAGLADPEKAAEILLNDFRAARLGKITLENPPDSESGQA